MLKRGGEDAQPRIGRAIPRGACHGDSPFMVHDHQREKFPLDAARADMPRLA
jgi:hypothetical protein